MSGGFYDRDMAERQERMAATPDMRDQRAVVMEALAPGTGERILEIGSGNGIFARELCERVGPEGHVSGLDAAEPMIELASRLCPEAEFVQGDASVLPFLDASFDAVTGAQVLCFLPDLDSALSEIARVLRPGGRAVLLDTDWASLIWESGEPDLHRRVIAAYTDVYADAHVPRSLSTRLRAAGLEVTGWQCFVLWNAAADGDTYAGQTIGFAAPIMEKAGFSAEEIDRWLDDQTRLDREGRFFFSLNRYVFTAEKAA